SVSAGGTLALDLSAGVGLKTPATGHKLEIADLANVNNYTPYIDGKVDLAGSISATLPLIGAVSWGGGWHANFAHNVTPTTSQDAFTTGSILSNLGSNLLNNLSGLSQYISNIPLMNQINGYLDQKIPVLDTSLRDLMGIGNGKGNGSG